MVYFNKIADLSHHNANADFVQAKSAIDAVFLKATQGETYVDPTFGGRRAQALNAGLLVGCYHFGTRTSGVNQAKHFLSTIGNHEGQLLVVDIEEDRDSSGKVQPSIKLNQTIDLINEIQRQTGKWPIIYGGHYLKGLIGDDVQPVLSKCPLWLAQYGNVPSWPKQVWQDFTLWQYTNGAVGPVPHEVPGIGRCDRSVFNGSEEQLKILWATASGEDVPVHIDDALKLLGTGSPIIAAGVLAHNAARAGDQPQPIPTDHPFPFAASTTGLESRRWPVATRNPQSRVVSYLTTSGRVVGSNGRRFLGPRDHGNRYHVAIDLFAEEGDTVVSCEAGKIVNFYPFYPSSTHEMTFALFVQHNDFVVNYGEVKRSSPDHFHWRVGDTVKAGQEIAIVSSTGMTHFETYALGTKTNERWYPGAPRPKDLLNPTQYLLEIAGL